MKEEELRKNATCGICKKKIGHTGLPLFWRVTIERFGIDMAAATRQHGLALQMGGNGLLAQMLGPDEELAKPVIEPVQIAVCESCALVSTSIAELGMPE